MKLRKFIRGDKFYFQILNDDKGVILESQAYQDKGARETGIESVKNNIGNPDRYEKISEDGKSFFILKAGNHQEIARSIGYTDDGDLQAAMEYAINSRSAGEKGAAPQADGGEAYGTDGRSDDYKPLSFYESNGSSVDNGFDSFTADGEFYFSYSVDGSICMISEGYKSEASRDNGIKSVEKNMNNKDRFETKQHPNGKHFFNLKAGNHQEIATSRWYDSAADMNHAVGRITGEISAPAPKAAASAAPEPAKSTKKSDDYLACREYQAHMSDKSPIHDDFIAFEQGEEFFFAWVADGQVVMRSERYASAKSRDNGIQSVIANRSEEKRFSLDEKAGHFFTVLKAGNHQEIARSCPHKEKSAAMAWFPSEIKKREEAAAKEAEAKKAEEMAAAKKVEEAAAAKKVEEAAMAKKAAEAAKSAKKADDYLPCREYVTHLNDKDSNHEDFISFEKDGEFFFAWVVEGDVVMRSERYASEASRDNGIKSVIANRTEEKRFSVEEKVGHFFTVLKAGNHQEIARSCPHKDKGAAMYWFPSEIAKREEAAAAAKKAEEAAAAAKKAAAAKAAAAKKAEEEEKAAIAKKAEIAAAAKTAAAKKAPKRSDDYLHCKYYKGHARSKQYKDFSLFEEDGEFYFAMLDSKDEVVLRSEGYASEKGRENGIHSVIKNRDIDGRYSTDEKGGMHYVVLKAGNHQEIGRSCPYKEKSRALGFIAPAAAVAAVAVAPKPKAAAPKPKAAAPKDKENDYLSCKEYENRTVNDKQNNVALFKHKNGQFYFALYNEKGGVKLRSEGFRTAEERDEELSGVLKYHDDDSMYKRLDRGKHFIDVLYDKTGREVGRSCLNKVQEKVVATAPVDKEDDYLPCKEYKNRTVNDKKNNVALFKHDKDGQYYFALYEGKGDVKLRSEGFGTAKERDQELSGVLKYHDNKDMYKRKEKGVYYMDVLYDKTGREVGRSCLKKKAAAKPVAATAAAAAAVVAPKSAPKSKPVPKKVLTPVPKKVVTPVAEKVVAPVVTSSGGGFKWWYLLPLLLIPLWFLIKGCDKEVVPPPPPPVKVEKPAPKPEPVKEATPPPPAPKPTPKPVVTGCNCSAKNIAIFNIPKGASAKSLSKLGTYPEFGNSHDLSPSAFYQKLSDRYSSNEVDRAYLDYVFRSMGYRGGFSDAKASHFSNVTLDRGQKGLLGLGEQHHYAYSQLNTSTHDREAFKIKSANGCDVHFMKTCGNYMFFCD